MEELYKAILLVAGAFVSFATFVFVLVKFAEPIKNFFAKIKKTDNIEKNYNDIKALDGENKAQSEEIKAINTQLTSVNGRLGKVETVLNDVANGVVVLLDNKINGSHNDADQQEALSNLKRHSKVV